MSASPVSIVSNSPATVELKFPVTKKVQFSVLDTSHFLPHPNIEALFRKRSVNGNCFARERTGEDGLGEVTLELGTWEVEVRNSTLPDGYYFSGPIETQQIVVIKEDDSKPVPPILIAKGRVLDGSFDGVDLTELRADWIFISIRDSTGAEVEYQGRHDIQGNFRVTLPPDYKNEEIVRFRIARATGPNRLGSLTIVSKSPWKLTWTPELVKSK